MAHNVIAHISLKNQQTLNNVGLLSDSQKDMECISYLIKHLKQHEGKHPR